MNLGFEVEKTNVGIRIRILEIPCVPILTDNFDFFAPNLPNRFWVRNFKKVSPKLVPPRYHV